MRPFFQSPIPWVALLFAALSAGLWEWSRSLPASHWETTGSTTASLPSPAASERTPAAAAWESAQPANENSGETTPAETATPQPTPGTDSTATVADSTPTTAAADSTATAAASAPAPESVTPPPTPTDTPLAGPLPEKSEPAAPAAPAAPPSPAAAILPPAPLDLAEIARQPALWPKQVLLLASVRFPVILNSVNVGNVQVQPGRAVILHKVNPDGTVEIELPGTQASRTKIKAEATDLLPRAQTLAAARKNGAPASESAP